MNNEKRVICSKFFNVNRLQRRSIIIVESK